MQKVQSVNITSEERHKLSKQAVVLVIDDEKAMRDSCSQVLTKEGYRTETAQDGDSGLQKVNQLRPDLVLVDLKMPGIGGMELLEKISQIDSSIVSIVITGYATIESAVEAMKRNAYDFISKPFTPDQFRIIVGRGLEKRKLTLESARLRQEKETMRENFITLVSHQLRSPLISIQQYFNVILEGFGFEGELAGHQKELIEKVTKRIDSLLKLIDDWLDMSRVEAGRLIENFEPVALEPILSEIVELLKPMAEAKKVTLETDFCNGLPKTQGDRESLKQAFTNLISNATQYNRQKGAVTISTKEDGDCLRVEICDTGIGISQENLHFIFDDFFRVKTKETRDITGSGLGLPIAKRIIEAHNGSIKVASKLGKGTDFTIFLPKNEVNR